MADSTTPTRETERIIYSNSLPFLLDGVHAVYKSIQRPPPLRCSSNGSVWATKERHQTLVADFHDARYTIPGKALPNIRDLIGISVSGRVRLMALSSTTFALYLSWWVLIGSLVRALEARVGRARL